jgi:tetratricopeptide (TPR) repeat protein
MMRAAPLLLLWLGLAAPVPPSDAAAALREGNRRFHAGDLEGAMEAYAAGYGRAAGYDGADPLLAYNLGTVAHHLERLPEALLWYRRAMAGDPARTDHPWLRENLELVREQLHADGARNETAAAAWSFWMDHHHRLVWTGILLAWAALPAVLLPRSARTRRVALTAVAIAAGAPFAAGLLLDRSGPQAAVLLQDCGEPADRLPAGSEIWVFPAAPPNGRGWRIPGSGLVCPDEAVGLVEAPPP